MSVLDTYEKIQAMVAQTTSTITAPTALPASINSANLPLALTFPGPSEWRSQAISYARQSRTYNIRVFVKPIAQGQGIDEGFQLVLPIMQAVGNKFLTSSGLSLENTVDHIDNLRDGGVVALTYAGIDYHGFEFSFSVIEKGVV